MAVTMTVATFDLNDCPIGAAQRIRCCGGHCRRRQSWSERKSAGSKSDQQKPFHLSVSSFGLALSRQRRKFRSLAEFHFGNWAICGSPEGTGSIWAITDGTPRGESGSLTQTVTASPSGPLGKCSGGLSTSVLQRWLNGAFRSRSGLTIYRCFGHGLMELIGQRQIKIA
jgi:hypothetical protein